MIDAVGSLHRLNKKPPHVRALKMVTLNLQDYIEIYKDLVVMNEVLKDIL